MLSQGIKLTLVGIIIGLAGAMALSGLVAGFLFNVPTIDLTTLIAVAVFIMAIALIASFIPARNASRVDPMVALRQE